MKKQSESKIFKNEFSMFLTSKRVIMNTITITANLHNYQSQVEFAINDLKENAILQRVLAHDHTVWKPDPNEISSKNYRQNSEKIFP